MWMRMCMCICRCARICICMILCLCVHVYVSLYVFASGNASTSVFVAVSCRERISADLRVWGGVLAWKIHSIDEISPKSDAHVKNRRIRSRVGHGQICLCLQARMNAESIGVNASLTTWSLQSKAECSLAHGTIATNMNGFITSQPRPYVDVYVYVYVNV